MPALNFLLQDQKYEDHDDKDYADEKPVHQVCSVLASFALRCSTSGTAAVVIFIILAVLLLNLPML